VASAAEREHVGGVAADAAIRTRQFYLMWTILLLNVTAGLGVLGQASPMIQEVFVGFSAPAAAAFVALLSFFNMGGRLLWATLSDFIGRRATYAVFFTLGPLLYAAVPSAGELGSVTLFVTCFALILSMYGGGFASLPAYVADVFGARDVGTIHGRLLTALSVAGVAGPALVNYLREYQIGHGVSEGRAYDVTMYILAVLLVLGFFCNRAIHPVKFPTSDVPRESALAA
jgi:nitrate/nitrite transporter NarK